MKEVKLKPCPFCGSKFAPDFEEDAYHNFRVLCRGCGASTALNARLIDAVKAWNRREPNDELGQNPADVG
jgi:Lar family restriction alleviation protein